jgi:hypothetical protein
MGVPGRGMRLMARNFSSTTVAPLVSDTNCRIHTGIKVSRCEGTSS